jgi:enoyl-CoA hydratase/carnithine racemase
MPESLRVEVADHIATVTIDRPPVNALNMGVLEEIVQVFGGLGDQPGVRVAILTGNGKYFSVGRDLKSSGTEPVERRFAMIADANVAIHRCPVPVIAAVNGMALGGGFSLVLNCDLIIASNASSFGWPEIEHGLSGGMAWSRRALNPYQARKLYFTGERLSAEGLLAKGIADSVVAPADLAPAARALASVLAAKSPTALRAAKWTANQVEMMTDVEQAFREVESPVSMRLAQSDDHMEAARAFAEKRPPVFKDS